MNAPELIIKKRDGEALSGEEIKWFFQSYVDGSLPEYQASAMLMAIFFSGMTDLEISQLTQVMVDSGEKIELVGVEGVLVDKHSTGGVGDKTSLVLGPLMAAAGCKMPKLSGRGLGHTGGTIDKLESIRGFSATLTESEFTKIVNKVGLAISGQSKNVVPADKKMYALRDVTGTVNSIPLIASSIMSKKLASDTPHIVLDVKTGSGAFMETVEEAEVLAKRMIEIGSLSGRKMAALITSMEEPLGYSIGNALEVKEAINCLQGNGPKDLEDLCLELGGNLLLLSGMEKTISEAKAKLKTFLHNGKAFEKFKDWVSSQGGDLECIESENGLPQAPCIIPFPSPSSGFVEKMVARDLGIISMKLGAGRMKKTDEIDLATGIVLNKKVGDEVKKGEPLFFFHCNSEKDMEKIKADIPACFSISDKPLPSLPLILKTLI